MKRVDNTIEYISIIFLSLARAQAPGSPQGMALAASSAVPGNDAAGSASGASSDAASGSGAGTAASAAGAAAAGGGTDIISGRGVGEPPSSTAFELQKEQVAN